LAADAWALDSGKQVKQWKFIQMQQINDQIKAGFYYLCQTNAEIIKSIRKVL
jgi:hypothetical protein